MESQTTETQNESALRALLGKKDTGEVLRDAVLALAAKEGVGPHEWLLSRWFGDKPKAKAKRTSSYKNEEMPGDAEVGDALLLQILQSTDGGVSGREWLKRSQALYEISKGGFYSRLEKFVAAGSVVVEEDKEPKVLYGREVMATVKTYWAPEVHKRTY